MFSKLSPDTLIAFAGRISDWRVRPIKRDWWPSLVATLGVLLWSLNFFPLQSVEYVLTSQIAISNQRLPVLQMLRDHNHGLIELKQACPGSKSASSLSILDFQVHALPPGERGSSVEPDLRSAQLRVKLSNRVSVQDVEAILTHVTTPTSVSSDCADMACQMRLEKWKNQVAKHMLRRLELDSELERLSEQEETDTSSQNPFRLASFLSRQDKQGPKGDIYQTVQQEQQSTDETIRSLHSNLAQLTSRSKGYLSFIGAPKIEPLAHAIPVRQLLILVGYTILVWFILVHLLARDPVAVVDPPIARRSDHVATQHPVERTKERDHGIEDVQRTIRWLQSSGLLYLGAIQIASAKTAPQVSAITATPIAIAAPTPQVVTAGKTPDVSWYRMFMNRCADGSIVFWIVLFGIRIAVDPHWRELMAVAPLAAFSRLLVGLPQV